MVLVLPSQVRFAMTINKFSFGKGNLDSVQGDFLQKKFFEMTPNAFKAFLYVKEVLLQTSQP